MDKLEVVYKNIADLIPYVNNARTHTDEQVAQVAASIKEFGFTNPILIDGEDGIIAGHGRLAAARKLKIESIPCVELKGLSEAQKKAYVIADNQLALNSGWNLDLLQVEIEGLKDLDFDVDLLGFDAAFIDSINGISNGFEDGYVDVNNSDLEGDPSVAISVGQYRTTLSHEEYVSRIESSLRDSVGLNEQDIIEEIMRRLSRK